MDTSPPSSLTRQTLVLRDGRRLGDAECGAPMGKPLLYCHGWPSSRLEALLLHRVSADLGLRVIAPDRPGYGLSDPCPGRALLEWPKDIRELADGLEMQRFAVLGLSGGGPFASACAFGLPGRVTRLLLVCSVAPVDSPGVLEKMVSINRGMLGMARRFPSLARAFAPLFLRVMWGRGHQPLPAAIERRLPRVDQQTLANPALRTGLTESAVEALRPGLQGAVDDGLSYARPWGFSLSQIQVSARLWHGGLDRIVPPEMGRALAAAIPGCCAVFLPGHGHFSLPFALAGEILKSAID
jgi:pimeloyl-ACP methyl ester carboxylesterase